MPGRLSRMLLLVFGLPLLAQAAGADPLAVYPANRRYFLRQGKPLALFGSGLWTIIPESDVDIAEHNEWYASHGANANRASLWAFCAQAGNEHVIGPWPRTGPGLANDGRPKFDLAKANEAFWQRANAYFADCQKRGIVVLLQMFDEPFTEGGPERWKMNPFNPENNVNHIPGLPGGQGSGEEAFYDPDNEPLTAVQEALIGRLLDETAAKYDNIIYEIGNEINMDSVTGKAAQWQQHWIDFFRAYEREHGLKLLLSNDTRDSLMRQARGSWGVMNSHGTSHVRFDRLSMGEIADAVSQQVRTDFADYGCPVIDSRPVSDPDRQRYGDVVSEEKGRAIYWSFLMSGAHVIGFRTTRESWKGGLAAERIIRSVHAFLQRIPFADMAPMPELVEGDHCLCLAKPGQVYAVYLPVGGKVTINLGLVPAGRRVTVSRYDPREAKFEPAGEVRPPRAEITLPSSGEGNDWALILEAH